MGLQSSIPADERGTGLLGAVIGVACVMGMLALTSNLALGLWTRSTVDAVAYDATRRVATAPVGSDLEYRAETSIRQARRTLGGFGSRVTLEFEQLGEDDLVSLRVIAPGTALLPRMIDGGPTVGAIDRTIVMRREGR